MLRVNKLAAPIDMIAAGTSAPIAIAAKRSRRTSPERSVENRAGTTSVADGDMTPAAIAI